MTADAGSAPGLAREQKATPAANFAIVKKS
jgi:hypothetical protein